MTSPFATGHKRWLAVTDTFTYRLEPVDAAATGVERDVLDVFLRDERVVDVTTDLQTGTDRAAGRLVVEVEAGVYLDDTDDGARAAGTLRDSLRLRAAVALEEIDALISLA